MHKHTAHGEVKESENIKYKQREILQCRRGKIRQLKLKFNVLTELSEILSLPSNWQITLCGLWLWLTSAKHMCVCIRELELMLWCVWLWQPSPNQPIPSALIKWTDRRNNNPIQWQRSCAGLRCSKLLAGHNNGWIKDSEWMHVYERDGDKYRLFIPDDCRFCLVNNNILSSVLRVLTELHPCPVSPICDFEVLMFSSNFPVKISNYDYKRFRS